MWKEAGGTSVTFCCQRFSALALTSQLLTEMMDADETATMSTGVLEMGGLVASTSSESLNSMVARVRQHSLAGINGI